MRLFGSWVLRSGVKSSEATADCHVLLVRGSDDVSVIYGVHSVAFDGVAMCARGCTSRTRRLGTDSSRRLGTSGQTY